MVPTYIYNVSSIDRVVNGDTVDLTIDLGFNMKKSDRFRLEDVDVPETWKPKTPQESTAGEIVKNQLISMINLYKNKLKVKTYKGSDIYGRYSCTLLGETDAGEPVNINLLLKSYMVANNYTKEAILEG